jgi:hypothetical protein
MHCCWAQGQRRRLLLLLLCWGNLLVLTGCPGRCRWVLPLLVLL